MTKIEWTHADGFKGETWNPLRARNMATGRIGHYCEHVSDGCRNCYAERLQPRFGNPITYSPKARAGVELYLDDKALAAPLRWRKSRMIFAFSMTDIFGPFVLDQTIDKALGVVAMRPDHRFLFLTKRPERMRAFMNKRGGDPLPNLWLGVSVENQATASERVPHLMFTPAAIRFVSYEPALGPVNFEHLDFPKSLGASDALRGTIIDGEYMFDERPLDWIIAGGESGPNARAPHPAWFRDVRDQCAGAGVAFFFKQWGEYGFDADGDGGFMMKVGKAAAGATLDGVEHREFPI